MSKFEPFTTAFTAPKAVEDVMQKALAGLTQTSQLSAGNLQAVSTSVNAMAAGAQALGAQTLDFVKKAADTGSEAARSLAAAKSPQQAIELQTAYAKTMFESYVAELNRWTETVSGTFRATLAPLQERAVVLTDQVKAAK